ncbi:MAG TPA: hypothetical protein VIJ34_09090 [Acidimicrobiales bacterium]
MHRIRCTSLAVAFTVFGSGISLLTVTGGASAAVIRQTTPVGISSITSQTLVASERALDPTSSGVLPVIGATRSINDDDIPKWLRDAAPVLGDSRSYGVLLGPSDRFPALGNDQGIGDCAIVAVRDVFIASARKSGKVVDRATVAQAVAAWQRLNGDTSNGLTDAELLDAWSAPSGVLGSTISGWGSLNVNWFQRIKQAIVSTGGVYASLNVPAKISWSKLVWSRPTSSSASMTDHAVALVGWVTQGWLAVTWGEVVLIPWSDWHAEAVGAYAVSPSPAE